MRRQYRVIICVLAILVLTAGCANRISVLDKGKEVSEERWEVKKIKKTKLSHDQKTVLSIDGKPDYIKFYRPLKKRSGSGIVRAFSYVFNGLKNVLIYSVRPVDSYRHIQAWIYEKEGKLVWFKDGVRVDYVIVEK